MATIGLVGGGPASLVLAIALARRGVRTTVFERDSHPERAPRFNPERSYTIDISGHGGNAIRHIGAERAFDERMLPFKGLKLPDGRAEEWTEPGWTGSRGDILRSLMSVVDAQYRDLVDVRFGCLVTGVDVLTGTITFGIGTAHAQQFDLVVGCDGAGSLVRRAMASQVPNFRVETHSYPNYCTMIELDRVPDRMDPRYLHGLAIRPFCVAGAIKPDPGSEQPRWFCAVGTKEKKTFASTEEARAFLRSRAPRVLDLTSDEKVEAYASRACYDIGRTLACSQMCGGNGVLLGDAAAAFPPIGQGVNAAMESAMVFDRCIGECDGTPEGLQQAARRYDERWRPEADAVAWMAVRSLFENRMHMLRASVASRLGISVFDQAKSSTVAYSEVRRQAERRWPLWV